MKSDAVRRTLAFLAAAACAAALAAGAIMAGNPGDERLRRFDQERSAALQSIASAVRIMCEQEGALPATLDAIAGRYPEVMSADPRTGQPYGYRRLAPNAFELCATFDLPSEVAPRPMPIGKPGGPPSPDYWSHPAGTTCWTERIEP